jgi:MFS family permease
MFGDQVSSVAIPYTGILALHADAAEMGFLTAAIWLPSLIFALHAGAWADRFGHRRILMITADLGRAGLLALIPVAALLHVLALWQLYAVAFAVGTLSVLFTVCDPALFVALVPSRRYVAGQSAFQAVNYGTRRRARSWPVRSARSSASGPPCGSPPSAALPGSCGCCLHLCQVSGCRPKIPLKRLA